MASKPSAPIQAFGSGSLERALFGGEVDGALATCFSNERPMAGAAGLLDWRFRGAISRYLRAGALSGAAGECAYLPFARQGRAYHLVLAGAGLSVRPGHRAVPGHEVMSRLRSNLISLRIGRVALSRKDFGDAPDAFFERELKGVPLWILP